MYQKINPNVNKLFFRVDNDQEGYVTEYLLLFPV
jgi:hypothetical protein